MSLLSIEWLKIRRYRTFWVLIGLFVLLLALWNLQLARGVLDFDLPIANDYSFPVAWENFGWWGSIFVLFLAILIITLTCNEYTFRTHRQNVIDGLSRLKFFHAKVALVLAISILVTALVFILGAAFGIHYSHGADKLTNGLKNVPYFFLLVLNYLGAALLVALLIRRSGLAISLFLLYALIAEIFLKFTLNHYMEVNWWNFLPLQSSDELLPFPLIRMGMKMANKKIETYPDYMYVIASIIWIAVYYFAARRIVLKRDM
jgi:ABC-type transport system involved in multi-copper enzyme maturation permease subunit